MRKWRLKLRIFRKLRVYVINELLRKTGKSVAEIDLFEINEAFAAVALASEQNCRY